jgi:hypothetical protein
VSASIALVVLPGLELISLESTGFPGNSILMGFHSWLNCAVDDEPIQLPIDGVLDLHTFRPREVKSLVLDYLAECRARGILRVRIIHGKGIGQLRQTVHAILEKHPAVASFNLASEHFGGWGATIVHLQPPAKSAHS